jgi:hypothetical protein
MKHQKRDFHDLCNRIKVLEKKSLDQEEVGMLSQEKEIG